MDREIPKEVRQKERNKKIIRYSSHKHLSLVRNVSGGDYLLSTER